MSTPFWHKFSTFKHNMNQLFFFPTKYDYHIYMNNVMKVRFYFFNS